jgi:hypothetical protein
MNQITLPSKASQGGAVFLPAAVREAIDLLGIERPVVVKIVAARNLGGTHRVKPDGRGNYFHSITIRTSSSPEKASSSLWHELTHAAQCETFETPIHFHRAYAKASAMDGGYRNNRYEVEARGNESLSEDLRLTKVTSQERAYAALSKADLSGLSDAELVAACREAILTAEREG